MKKLFNLACLLYSISTLANVPIRSCAEYIKKGNFIYADDSFPLISPKILKDCSIVQNPILDHDVQLVPYQANACIVVGDLSKNGSSKKTQGVAVLVNLNGVDLKAPHGTSGYGLLIASQTNRKGSTATLKKTSGDGFELELAALNHDDASDDTKERAVYLADSRLLRILRSEFDKKSQKFKKTFSVEFFCK